MYAAGCIHSQRKDATLKILRAHILQYGQGFTLWLEACYLSSAYVRTRPQSSHCCKACYHICGHNGRRTSPGSALRLAAWCPHMCGNASVRSPDCHPSARCSAPCAATAPPALTPGTPEITRMTPGKRCAALDAVSSDKVRR
jgi:hypothetical protein